MKRKTLKQVALSAVSKKMAYYNLYLEEEPGCFIVRKQSGGRHGHCDQREWRLRSYVAAEKLYDRKLREKTNPHRKAKRIYRIAPEDQLPLTL